LFASIASSVILVPTNKSFKKSLDYIKKILVKMLSIKTNGIGFPDGLRITINAIEANKVGKQKDNLYENGEQIEEEVLTLAGNDPTLETSVLEVPSRSELSDSYIAGLLKSLNIKSKIKSMIKNNTKIKTKSKLKDKSKSKHDATTTNNSTFLKNLTKN
jgi:hypothetical protein